MCKDGCVKFLDRYIVFEIFEFIESTDDAFEIIYKTKIEKPKKKSYLFITFAKLASQIKRTIYIYIYIQK